MIPGAIVRAQSSANTAIARAQALAESGDTTAARTLVDSVLADTDPEMSTYFDALYWRGALAQSFDEGRKNFLRLVVEYPFSPLVGEALYRLAAGEVIAGDRRSAQRHLERLLRDHAGSPSGPRGAFELAKMLMTDGDVRAACAALDSALAYEPAGNIETRNQIAYSQRPCERLSNDPVEPPPSSVRSGRSGGSAAPPTAQPTPARRWSVQVAALDGKSDAAALAARLKVDGYDSRVFGSQAPYRVRIGRFATRVEATAIVAKLKAGNQVAIVVEAERP
ncbi:MAG: SPOR domain-containing protein [Gemmatimonadetes bacterium]|nr:SPOR domain-containing protein [Gemmatimonadota bacterium]